MISSLTRKIITGTNKELNREEEMHDLGYPSEIKESFETAKEAQRFVSGICHRTAWGNATRVKLKCDKGNTQHVKARRVPSQH